MASSAFKEVTAGAVAATISELENDAVSWSIQAVGDLSTYGVGVTTKIAYTGSTFGLDSGETASITIPENETISSIQLVYNDGSDTVMHTESVDETFTYGGEYVITSYVVTLTHS